MTEQTPADARVRELEPCPFCQQPLTVGHVAVNPLGRCDTEDCWMHRAKIAIPLDDPMNVAAWNTRAAMAEERRSVVELINSSIEGRWQSRHPDDAYRDAYHTGIADACTWLAEDIASGHHLARASTSGEGE